MSKTIVLFLDSTILSSPEFDRIIRLSDLLVSLNKNGTWSIHKNRQVVSEAQLDLVDLFTLIADLTGTDYNSPRALAPICTCPTECDCADPDNGLKSNSCPIHNEQPDYDPTCPQHSLL